VILKEVQIIILNFFVSVSIDSRRMIYNAESIRKNYLDELNRSLVRIAD
jgi:hypothetical protein